MPGSRIPVATGTAINKRLRELEKALAKPGRLPPGMGTRKDALTALGEAKAQSFQADTIQSFNNTEEVLIAVRQELDNASAELTARNRPYHGGRTNLYPGMKAAELDGYAVGLDDFVQELEASQIANKGLGDPNIPEITLAEEVTTASAAEELAPRTSVQGGFGIGEPAQQVSLDIGGQGAPLAPLIPPEQLAAQQRRVAEGRAGQQALPEGGPTQRVGGIDMQLVDTQTVGGVRHELYQGENSSALRLMDEDSGNRIHLKIYKNKDQGLTDFAQTLQRARYVAGEGAEAAPAAPAVPEEVLQPRFKDVTEHSKVPMQPPEGFIRLKYRDQATTTASGPNYVYVKPEWIDSANRMSVEDGILVQWTEPDKVRTKLSAKVDEETGAQFLGEGAPAAAAPPARTPVEEGLPANPYRNPHQPHADGPQAHNIIENDLVPTDIYDHPEFYIGDPRGPVARETARALKLIRGKPEALVTVYRAGPVKELNDGDWVTFSRSYAKGHGMDPTEPLKDMPVHSFKVKAKDVRWDMNSLEEFGYFPGRADDVPVPETPAAATEAVPAPAPAPEVAPVRPRTTVTVDGVDRPDLAQNVDTSLAPETAVVPTEAPEAPLAATGAPAQPPSAPSVAPPPAPIPPEGSPVGQVFSRISINRPQEGLASRFLGGWDRFKREMLDDIYSIEEFEQAARRSGATVPPERSPYIAGRLLRGNTAKADVMLEHGTFGSEFWKMEGGRAVPNFRGPGLEEILESVKEPVVWRDFATYLTSKRAVELTGRQIKTGIPEAHASDAIRALESQYPNFPEVAESVYRYQDELLKYGQEMGLLAPDLVAKLRGHKAYVPFHRVMEEVQARGSLGKKMANISSPIRRMKGSERPIVNPLESIVKNTYMMVSAADRNQVGLLMADLVKKVPELNVLFKKIPTPQAKVATVTAEELGISVEGLGRVDTEAVYNIFRPSTHSPENVVTVMRGGKKEFYQVEPELYKGLLALDRKDLGLIQKFLSLPARWLRAGAILSPDFMIRNPVRDQLSAMAFSKYGFVPGVDFMRGMSQILRKTDDYLLYKMSGSEHSMLVSMDRDYLQKSFKDIVGERGPTDYMNPLAALQKVSELSEKGTRLGEFTRGLSKGASPIEAGFNARDLMDYNKMGSAARAINQIIPFYNAAIRGTDKLITSFRTNPVRTSLLTFMGITLPSLILYSINRDDPRYQEIQQWQKDLFWIIIPPGNAPIIRIPKPFELGVLFGSIPERLLEDLDRKDEVSVTETLKELLEVATPGYIPQIALPIIENSANHSFFLDRPIVSRGREAFPPELQYGGRTSETAKKAGEWVNYSPSKIDNLIRGWTAGLGQYALQITDQLLEGTGIVSPPPDPEGTLADLPVIKAFVVRDPFGSSSESVNRFYERLDEFTRHERFLKEMLRLGEEKKFEDYKAAHPEALLFYDFQRNDHYSRSARDFRRVARGMSEIRESQRDVYESRTMTPEEKRARINASNKDLSNLAREALNKYPVGGKSKPTPEPIAVPAAPTPAPGVPTPTPGVPARAPTPTEAPTPSRWEDVSPLLAGQIALAIGEFWKTGKPLTSQDLSQLRRVHTMHPMGQPDFDAWLGVTLRQALKDYVGRQSSRLPEPTPVGAGR